MNINVTAAPADLTVKATWQPYLAEAKDPMSRISIIRSSVMRRTGLAACTTNAIFCLSLWTSLFAAIWLTKGWIGLLFSGQVLSAGTCLFEKLAKRTHYAFSTCNGPAHELESERNS